MTPSDQPENPLLQGDTSVASGHHALRQWYWEDFDIEKLPPFRVAFAAGQETALRCLSPWWFRV